MTTQIQDQSLITSVLQGSGIFNVMRLVHYAKLSTPLLDAATCE